MDSDSFLKKVRGLQKELAKATRQHNLSGILKAIFRLCILAIDAPPKLQRKPTKNLYAYTEKDRMPLTRFLRVVLENPQMPSTKIWNEATKGSGTGQRLQALALVKGLIRITQGKGTRGHRTNVLQLTDEGRRFLDTNTSRCIHIKWTVNGMDAGQCRECGLRKQFSQKPEHRTSPLTVR